MTKEGSKKVVLRAEARQTHAETKSTLPIDMAPPPDLQSITGLKNLNADLISIHFIMVLNR